MHIVYVHDAKIVKENGLTLQFCSNYPPKMSRIDAMYICLLYTSDAADEL